MRELSLEAELRFIADLWFKDASSYEIEKTSESYSFVRPVPGLRARYLQLLAEAEAQTIYENHERGTNQFDLERYSRMVAAGWVWDTYSEFNEPDTWRETKPIQRKVGDRSSDF